MTNKRRLAATLGVGAVVLGLVSAEFMVGRPAPTATVDSVATYGDHLTAVDNALARSNVSAAVRAWHDAYNVALVSGGWEPLIEVGDAYLRIGDAAGTPAASKANARHVYMSALRRAQRAGDADGVLAVASAFAGLGDEAVSVQCATLAERLATARGDVVTLERVRGFRARHDELALVATLDRF